MTAIVIAGLDPAIHRLENNSFEEDGCASVLMQRRCFAPDAHA
jgi:hypothetical protein